MKKSKLISLLGVFTLALFLFSSCSKESTENDASGGTENEVSGGQVKMKHEFPLSGEYTYEFTVTPKKGTPHSAELICNFNKKENEFTFNHGPVKGTLVDVYKSNEVFKIIIFNKKIKTHFIIYIKNIKQETADINMDTAQAYKMGYKTLKEAIDAKYPDPNDKFNTTVFTGWATYTKSADASR